MEYEIKVKKINDDVSEILVFEVILDDDDNLLIGVVVNLFVNLYRFGLK